MQIRAASRRFKIFSGVAAAVAFLLLARLTVFMVDSSKVGYSVVPGSLWETQHSCLSAYYVSGEAVSQTPDVYDNALYSQPDDDPGRPRKARLLGPFKIDVYEYPPPFLLAPRALRFVAPDFDRLRALWFGLSGAVWLIGTVVVARFMGGSAGTRALLLSPLVWLSLPMLGTLQKGNAQIPVIAAAMIAMVLFEKRQNAAGGLLLAFITLSKLYPGMLAVYLLVQRRWRALGFTAAAGVAIFAVSLLDTGWPPYQAFLRHLPGILSGEAFPAFRNPMAMANNLSIPGLVFKLKLFGVPHMSFPAAKAVGWVYTIVVIGVTALIARRTLRDDEKPLAWCSVLILSTLRSPFLPMGYATIPSLWLLTLWAARRAPDAKAPLLIAGAWLSFNLVWPGDWPLDPRMLAVVTLIPMAVTLWLVAQATATVPRPRATRSP